MKAAFSTLAMIALAKPATDADVNEGWSFRRREPISTDGANIIDGIDLDDVDIEGLEVRLSQSVELVPFGDVDAHRRDGSGFLVLARPLVDTGFEADPHSDPNFDVLPPSDDLGDDALYADGYDRATFQVNDFDVA